jgi:hypothetical protein
MSSQSLHSLNNNKFEGKSFNFVLLSLFLSRWSARISPYQIFALWWWGGCYLVFKDAGHILRTLGTSSHQKSKMLMDAPKDPRTQSPSTKIPPPFISIPHGGGGPFPGTEGKCCTNTLLDIAFFNYLRGDPPRLILYDLYSYLFVASIFYRFL